jgi:RNA polymerase sigma-70 factor (ECF subfamily)
MADGGSELLTRLLDEHAATLVLYARQWTREPEDVVQNALLALVRERPAPVNVVGWLYRVVRNGAISASRSSARRSRHESQAAQRGEAWFGPNPDDAIDAAAATQALAELDPDLREVIVLRLWAGFSFQQIADVTQSSTSSAHRRYVAGLTALRERSSPCANPTNQTT